MIKESLENMLTTTEIYWENDFPLLFHYTSLEAACKIIESNRLKLGNLSKTNDPLEFCKPSGYGMVGPISTEEHCRILREDEQAKDSCRILCFCHDVVFNKNGETVQTICNNYLWKGWGKNRMWAQYADNHRGVCLVFDKDELLVEFKKLQDNGIIIHHGKINYSNYFHKLDNCLFKGHEIDYLFQKCEDFRDENEYRLCTIGTNKEIAFGFGDSLKAIILGARVSPYIKIVPLLSNPIEQFRIRWNFGMPELQKYQTNA